MVKVKDDALWASPDGSIDVTQWLNQLAAKGYFQDMSLIRNACTLSHVVCVDHATETGVSCLQQGLAMADILADLGGDQETLAAAIMFVSVHYAEFSLDDVEEQLGSGIAKLVKGIEKMSAMHNMQAMNKPQQKHQLDNVRKMLLAMVDDARVVLIKLAERLCVLRSSGQLPETMRKHIAAEAMDIYAPLANRLGIGAIKWEMEDLAFRYLHPDDYKAIAKGLKARRLDRDRYVEQIVTVLNDHISAAGVKRFSVYGRSKHIHSIYKKMKRKNVSLDEIYDATAVRILVETVEQCYDVLGMVHSIWQQIPAEFDDYIINTKANGYQSLHTAVIGPEERSFEVQIRTFDMHDQAEMGVAAHWKYKEGSGGRAKESHERKIEWLRDVLAWHRDVAKSSGVSEEIESGFLDDRVYVFTPDGDVLDLPNGVTPLDFAYHVHSQVGHRCRGAKVNGAIVPLTYSLKTGDRIEVLTGKEIRPSRDWINPHLNYLKTPRARAKVLHWFKMQDYDKNLAEGHEILDKELKSLGIKAERLQDVIVAFNFKKADDVYAALGRGDIKLGQILHRLVPAGSEPFLPSLAKAHHAPEVSGGDLTIEGVGNLLTIMARCCQPVPGDTVVGYITLGRGVSVHRKDCPNIIHASDKQRQRFIQVSWGSTTRDHYVVDLLVKAFNRNDLLKDVTSLLANEKAQVYALQTQSDKQENTTFISLTVEIDGLNTLSRLLSKLERIPNVLEARRQV